MWLILTEAEVMALLDSWPGRCPIVSGEETLMPWRGGAPRPWRVLGVGGVMRARVENRRVFLRYDVGDRRVIDIAASVTAPPADRDRSVWVVVSEDEALVFLTSLQQSLHSSCVLGAQ